MERDRRPLYIWLLFAVADALMSAYYWPRLPETVAQHFDAAGRPNGWSPRADLFLMMWALILGTGLIFLVAPKLLRTLPFSLVNVPHKSYWAATPERQQRAIAIVEDQLAWLAVGVIALHSLIFAALLHSATSGNPRFPGQALVAAMAAFLAFTVGWSVVLIRRYKPPETQ